MEKSLVMIEGGVDENYTNGQANDSADAEKSVFTVEE